MVGSGACCTPQQAVCESAPRPLLVRAVRQAPACLLVNVCEGLALNSYGCALCQTAAPCAQRACALHDCCKLHRTPEHHMELH